MCVCVRIVQCDILQKELATQKPASDAFELDHKRVMAVRAYQQWLINKKEETQQKSKEGKIEKELKALYEEQRKMEQEKAQVSFSSWKKRKDMERKLKPAEMEAGYLAKVENTPLLPGYCSVWSCDEELADHMLARIQRQI